MQPQQERPNVGRISVKARIRNLLEHVQAAVDVLGRHLIHVKKSDLKQQGEQ